MKFLIVSTTPSQANVYLFKVNNRNNKKGCNMSKFNNNYTGLVSLLLTWTYSLPFFNVSIFVFEQVNVSWANNVRNKQTFA